MLSHPSRKLRILAAFLLGVVILWGAYAAYDQEKFPLDENTRASAPGDFIELPDGMVHYELTGPATGPLVVLVHGFSAPMFAWDRNAPVLAQAGFRVLRFDLYGRGYSDRPPGPYNLDLFLRQISGLLQALEIQEPVHLVGLSMGGALVAAFTNQYPDRVASVTLVDPQVVQITPQTIFPVNLPGVGEYLYTVYIQPYILARQEDSFYNPALLPEWQANYRVQMQYRGFRRALISTLRHFDIDPMAEYARLGKTGKPILLVMGEEDRTVPISYAPDLLERLPGARFQALPEAGHVSNYERADLFNPLVIEFLDSLTRR
ncbi:predicted hydrolase [Anaerolinea thermolimosa]|nr:predicted hydrolase [Anaerolinea thermolimosa]